MKSYLAAAVCMTSTPDVEANLNQAEELIELAVNQGAKLIGLPENFSFLGRDEEKIAQVETIATKSEKFFDSYGPAFSGYYPWGWFSYSP